MQRVVLGSEPGVVLHLLELGATVHRLDVTGGDGVRRNVALGYDDPKHALRSKDYLGSTIGRYANRIAGGRFTLDGHEVQLPTNDRGNHLHGGTDGFDRRVWRVREHSPHHAVLTLRSPDGDQGFPGNLDVEARFEVAGSSVSIDLTAETDASTIVNLTNHTYFNLAGGGSVERHELLVDADLYTPVDATGIPLGDDASVSGTPFDLRTAAQLRALLVSQDQQIRAAGGLDHNFVLKGEGWRRAAVLSCPLTRTVVEVSTDQPGLQVYTGNAFDGTGPTVTGRPLRPWDGIALEPQLRPDTPNQAPGAAVLRPGEKYRARIGWSFGSVPA